MNEAQDRKSRSERILAGHGVTVSYNLPVLESAAETSLRPPRVVAERACALYGVVLQAQGGRAYDFLPEAKMWGLLSPQEQAFFLSPPQVEESPQFSWRSEALWVLLWSLGYVPRLDYPDAPCDEEMLTKLMAQVTGEECIGEAEVRPADRILDEADLIYRCHWAVSEAEMRDAEPPGNLNADVVYERHYALNWLLGYMQEEWDDVSTDT